MIFPNLRNLRLTHTKITDESLEILKSSKISSLEIDDTLVTNKAIKVLRDWKHLEILNISYTKIDDAALEDILKLNIGSLNAAGTKLSDKAKERIRKKMQFEDEEYEIQCPGTEDSKCPEF
ncbi:leucine rich repeat protein [Leptospira interrogans serovar Bataviae str. HAI135]|nr:leucine rich repeat protein [Leptospira interrogans serovar Bataviae str. HAI135]